MRISETMYSRVNNLRIAGTGAATRAAVLVAAVIKANTRKG